MRKREGYLLSTSYVLEPALNACLTCEVKGDGNSADEKDVNDVTVLTVTLMMAVLSGAGMWGDSSEGSASEPQRVWRGWGRHSSWSPSLREVD